MKRELTRTKLRNPKKRGIDVYQELKGIRVESRNREGVSVTGDPKHLPTFIEEGLFQ